MNSKYLSVAAILLSGLLGSDAPPSAPALYGFTPPPRPAWRNLAPTTCIAARRELRFGMITAADEPLPVASSPVCLAVYRPDEL